MINEYLRDEGYNARERLNIYAGVLVGLVTPISVIRYGIFSNPSGVLGEVVAWGCSTLLSFPVTIYPWSLPGCGAMLGILEAERLREKRIFKQTLRKEDLEKMTEEITNQISFP